MIGKYKNVNLGILFDHLHLINYYNMNPYNYSICLPHGSGVPCFVWCFVYVVALLILIYDRYVHAAARLFSFYMRLRIIWGCCS